MKGVAVMNLNTINVTCLTGRWKTSLIMLFLISALTSFNAQAMNVLASSDFDGAGNFDDWTAHRCGDFGLCPIPTPGFGGDFGAETPGGATFFHESDQGNPGGNLHATDPVEADSTMLFNAPVKFLNNLTQGTTLSFDMFIDGVEYSDTSFGIPLFYAHNGPDIMLYAVDADDAPLGEWISFVVDIQPNGAGGVGLGSWYTLVGGGGEDDGTVFNNIFGSGGLATELRFWGELTRDKPEGVDGVLLDNVIITAPVPVPAALPLLLSALAGFGFLGSRRKRN